MSKEPLPNGNYYIYNVDYSESPPQLRPFGTIEDDPKVYILSDGTPPQTVRLNSSPYHKCTEYNTIIVHIHQDV